MKLLGLLSVMLVSLSLCGCETNRVSANTSAARAQQFIVLVDLSASRSPAMKADAQTFLHDLVTQLSFGDELVLMQMQEHGLVDHPRKWNGEMPVLTDPSYVSARDKSHLRAAQAGMMVAVDSFLKPESSATLQNTDILTTLQLAGEQVHDSEGRSPTILLLSDMLQSAQGIEMERLSRMPRPDWISKQKSLGLIPNFNGACVVVVGANATNAAGARVRDFWRQYFNAAGAPLADTHYRALPPPANHNLCG
jgi:hypothetical protein